MKYPEKKAGLSKKEKVQALLDLKNSKKGGSAAEAERVKQEMSIMRNRKKAYFDAVKRANKPTAGVHVICVIYAIECMHVFVSYNLHAILIEVRTLPTSPFLYRHLYLQ